MQLCFASVSKAGLTDVAFSVPVLNGVLWSSIHLHAGYALRGKVVSNLSLIDLKQESHLRGLLIKLHLSRA